MSCQPTDGGCTHEASPSKHVATTRAYELSGNCGLTMRRLRPLTCRVLVEIVRDRDNLPRERQTRETLRGRDSYCGYESLAQRSRVRRRPRLRQGCAAKYPRSKVGNEGTTLVPGEVLRHRSRMHHGRCTRRRRIGHDRVNRVATLTLASRTLAMRLARRCGDAGTITPAAAALSYRETVAAFLLSFRRRNSLLDVLRTTRDEPNAAPDVRASRGDAASARSPTRAASTTGSSPSSSPGSRSD